jgi:starch synthase
MSNDGIKILFIAAEATPIVKVGGLADVAGALPQALKTLGYDVRIMLPAYGAIDRTRWEMKPYNRPFAINLGGEPQAAEICTGTLGDVPVYYVDHAPTFSDRPVIYAGAYEDAARFVIFGALALAALDQIDWRPDVIHLNDWHTAIMARWLRNLRRELRPPPTLLTIHNLDYQGVVYRPNLGWAASLLPQSPDQIINLLYEGLANTDTITTVSPTYAREIMTPEYGAGLQDLLRMRSNDVVGILNGIDTTAFDPATDRHIAQNYSIDSIVGKAACKRALQEEAGLPVREDVPVFGMVTRLVEQKGLDILAQALPELLSRHDVQLVILGTGDPYYHQVLNNLAEQHSDRFRLWLKFDAGLAQRIYAGSDAFLMPSRFEPCGLGQMIAMRYGTVPVVRATGGLADTVTDLTYNDGDGVLFGPYRADALAHAVQRAVEAFANKNLWQALIERGMQRDWSWTQSARRYGELYERAVERHRSIIAASI